MTCTTLDHTFAQTTPGAPCRCGQRTWGGTKPAALKPGAKVRVIAEGPGSPARTIVRRLDRHGLAYELDRVRARGRCYFDRGELEVVVSA